RFKSKSHDFPRMLAVRVRELKEDGILKAAPGQPGVVLGQHRPVAQAALPASTKRSASPRRTAKRGTTSARAGVQRALLGKPGKQPPLREVLTQVLKKSTRPMTGSELAAEALKAGYRSTSKNFVDVVWVAMGNMKNVEHVPDQGYRIKK